MLAAPCGFGKTTLSPLEEAFSGKPDKFYRRVIKAARVQAVYYPDFLKPRSSHILQKLGASRRSEAKTIAEKLHII